MTREYLALQFWGFFFCIADGNGHHILQIKPKTIYQKISTKREETEEGGGICADDQRVFTYLRLHWGEKEREKRWKKPRNEALGGFGRLWERDAGEPLGGAREPRFPPLGAVSAVKLGKEGNLLPLSLLLD